MAESTRLLDAYDRPVNLAALRREHAADRQHVMDVSGRSERRCLGTEPPAALFAPPREPQLPFPSAQSAKSAVPQLAVAVLSALRVLRGSVVARSSNPPNL